MKKFVVKLKSIVDNLFHMNRGKVQQVQIGGTIKPHGGLIVEKKSPGETEVKSEQIGIGEQIVAVLKREEEIRAIRIADSTSQSVSANVLNGNLVDFTIQGRSRQNEEGNYNIGRILLARLNRDGAIWDELECFGQVDARREQGFDCQAKADESRLYIQITRAETDGQVWKTLGKTGQSSAKLSADLAADALHKAIEKKAIRISPQERPQITLALDATETVSHTFRPVLESFASRYGTWAKELKFNGIWLVGPNVALTSRLDE